MSTKEEFKKPNSGELIKTPENIKEQKGIEPSSPESEDPFEAEAERIKSLRLNLKKAYEEKSLPYLTAEDNECIELEAREAAKKLNECYQKGFGISPSGNPSDSFYNTLWTRDLSHAGGNYFAKENIEPMINSLKTVFSYQKEDGSLPYRVEKKRFLLEHTMRAVFGINLNVLKKIGIDVVTRDKERPVYEGQDGGNAEDTIPSVVISLGELFISSKEGRDFVRENFDKIKKAMDYFVDLKTDPEDGLKISKEKNPDWADSLLRGGKKIGTINIWYARALRMMQLMSIGLNKKEESGIYKEKSKKVKEWILEKLYDKENHYFRTGEGEDRIDAVASIFGSLYLLPVTEAAKVEETMKKKLTSNSRLLKNFYPPYPQNRIDPLLKRIGMGGYHNEAVWPWVSAQNIEVKIKIAREHPDEQIRAQFKKEAVDDLLDIAKLFKDAGGAYEVFDPETRGPATTLRTGVKKYKIPKNLMGNLASYQSAYTQLKKLNWIQ